MLSSQRKLHQPEQNAVEDLCCLLKTQQIWLCYNQNKISINQFSEDQWQKHRQEHAQPANQHKAQLPFHVNQRQVPKNQLLDSQLCVEKAQRSQPSRCRQFLQREKLT